MIATLLALGGCGGGAPGQETVEVELSRLENSVLGSAEIRKFEFQHDEFSCDKGDSFYSKRGFITIDGRGVTAVRDAFVEEYRARDWSIEQYRSDGLDVVRLVATRPDGALTVDVGIRSSGAIDIGSVRYSPCGDEYNASFVGRDWDEVPVGS